jgi:hypothetical protein
MPRRQRLSAVAARHAGDVDAAGLQLVLGMVVLGAGVVLEVVGLVVVFRGGRWRRAWRAPTMVLTRRQRRQLLGQVRGRAPADPARLPLARDLAGRLVDQLRLVVVFTGIAVLQVGQAIITPETWRVLTSSGLVLLYAYGGVLTGREARRARRFLERHPAQPVGPDVAG